MEKLIRYKEEVEEEKNIQYDGLGIHLLEVTPQGVLCSSVASIDGTMTVNGNWMDSATDL